MNKRVFNYCQTSVLFLYKGATLVIYRAHGPYTLVGPPVRGLVLDSLVVLTSTSVCIYQVKNLNGNALNILKLKEDNYIFQIS